MANKAGANFSCPAELLPFVIPNVKFTGKEIGSGAYGTVLEVEVDEAVDGCDCVKKVFVSKRTGAQVPMHPRDIPMEEVRCTHTAVVAPG